MAVQNGILKQGSGITFISRCILRQENILPNRYLLVQSSNSTMETVGAIKAPEWHHWHRSGVFIIWFWTNFTHCSGVSNVDIGQVNSSWIWAYFYQCFPVFFVTSALFRSRLARIEIKRKVVRNRFKKFFFLVNITVWSVRIRSFSDPHFPAFGLNTVIYIVKLRIRALFSQCVSQFDPMSNKS